MQESAVDRGMAMEKVFTQMAQQGMTPRLGHSRGTRNLRAAVLEPPKLHEWDDQENLAGFGTQVLENLRTQASPEEIASVFGEEIAILTQTHSEMTPQQKAQFGKSVRRQFGNQAYDNYLNEQRQRKSVSRDQPQEVETSFGEEALSGLVGGFHAMVASYYGNRAMNSTNEEYRAQHMESAGAAMDRAAALPSDAPTFTEIEGVRDAAKWFTRTMAENTANMSATIGAGWAGAKTGAKLGAAAGPKGALIGGFVGAMTSSFYVASRMYRGGLYHTTAEGGASHEDASAVAKKYGDLAGAASMVVPGALMGAVAGGMGKNFVRSKVKDTLMYAGASLGAEGMAEAIAESFVITGEEIALGHTMEPSQKRDRIINAAAAGAALGTGMGGIAGAMRKRGTVDDIIDEFIVLVEKDAEGADKQMLASYLQSELARSGQELTPDQQAVLDFISGEGAPSNRRINRGMREIHAMGIEVATRAPQQNAQRFVELVQMDEAQRSGNDAYELAAILANTPQLRELVTQMDDTPAPPPAPESEATINAQMRAITDQSSTKDTMIVTPGSPMPENMPEGILQVETPDGVVLTTNQEKADAIAQAEDGDRERILGMALYDRPEGKEGSDGLVIRVLDKDGNPISEIATSFETLQRDIESAEGMATAGGSVRVSTAGQTLRAREQANAPPATTQDTKAAKPGGGRVFVLFPDPQFLADLNAVEGDATAPTPTTKAEPEGPYSIAGQILEELGISLARPDDPNAPVMDLNLSDPRTAIALRSTLGELFPDPQQQASILSRLTNPDDPLDANTRDLIRQGIEDRMRAVYELENFNTAERLDQLVRPVIHDILTAWTAGTRGSERARRRELAPRLARLIEGALDGDAPSHDALMQLLPINEAQRLMQEVHGEIAIRDPDPTYEPLTGAMETSFTDDGKPIGDTLNLVQSKQIADGGKVSTRELKPGEKFTYTPRTPSEFLRDMFKAASSKGAMMHAQILNFARGKVKTDRKLPDSEYEKIGRSLVTLKHDSGKDRSFHLPTITSGAMDLGKAEGSPGNLPRPSHILYSFLSGISELASQGFDITPNLLGELLDSYVFGDRNHNKQEGDLVTLRELLQSEYKRLEDATKDSDDSIIRAAKAEMEAQVPKTRDWDEAYTKLLRAQVGKNRSLAREQKDRMEKMTGEPADSNVGPRTVTEVNSAFDTSGQSVAKLDQGREKARDHRSPTPKPSPTVVSDASTGAQTDARRAVDKKPTPVVKGFGKSIDKRIVNFVRGVLDELGMTHIGMTVADVKSLGTLVRAGELTTEQAREVRERFQHDDQLAVFVPTSGNQGVIIVRDLEAFGTGKDAEGSRLMAIGHEIGHGVYNGIEQRILDPQTPRDKTLSKKLNEAYQKDKTNDPVYEGSVGFREWFADKLSARARGYVTNKPHGLVERFFADSIAELKKVFNAVKGRLPKRFHANRTFNDVVDAYKKDNVFTNIRSIKGDGRIENMRLTPNMTRTQMRANAARLQNAVRTLIHGADVRRTPGLYFLFDVHNQALALGFKRTADAVYQETNTRNEGAYWTQVRKQFDLFQGELQKIFPRGENAEVSKRAFMQLAMELPDNQLSRKALKVRNMMREFKRYLDGAIPNIGNIDDFFPRTYMINEINNRSAEVTEILMRHGFNEQQAAQWIEDMTSDRQAGLLDSDYVMGKSSHLHKHRQLTDADAVRDLVEGGFLNANPYNTLMAYMRKSVRRAELERKFGGYKVLKGWKIEPVSPADHASNRAIMEGYLQSYGYDVSDNAAFNASLALAEQHNHLVMEQSANNVPYPTWRDPIMKLEQIMNEEAMNKYVPQALKKLGLSMADAQNQQMIDLVAQTYIDPDTGAVTPIIPEKEFKHVKNVVYHMLDAHKPHDPDSILYNLTGELRAYQALRTLAFSGVASIPEFAALYTRNKETLGLMDFARLTIDTVRSFNDVRTLGEGMGIVTRDIQDVILQEMLADHNTGKFRVFRRAVPALFSLNANNYILSFTRTIGTSLGQAFIVNNARTARDQNATPLERARALRYLEEIGVTDLAKVDAWVADFERGRPRLHILGDPSPINQIRKEMQGAVGTFVSEGVLMPTAPERPSHARHPIGGLFFHLKSFMYSYNKRVLGGMYREGEARATEQAAFGMGPGESAARMTPFYLAAAGLFIFLGAASDEIRNRIASLGGRGTWESNWKNPTRMVGKWVDRAGFTSMPYQGAVPIPGIRDVSPWDVAFASGPVFSHGYELFTNASNGGLTKSDAMKMVPGLSQMPAVRRAIHEATK
jgi:hypothetical protein